MTFPAINKDFWENLEVHDTDVFAWVDTKTNETVYIMDFDGDYILTPCADDVIKEVIRK